MDCSLKIYAMMMPEDLDYWVKHKAKPGDMAYHYDHTLEQYYFYAYNGPDEKPFWRACSKGIAEAYIEEVIKERKKIEETKMNKRCDNCKYFNGVTMSKITDYWCTHEKYSGIRVAAHTCCPEHAAKEKLTTPFDGMKLYLKNKDTGELSVNYICEDCGKEMVAAPDRWWLVFPLNDRAKRVPGYHFRCKECDKKKEGKI